MEMEQQKDSSETREVGNPKTDSQQAIQLAIQVALQLRGNSKEKLENFLPDALKAINATRDLIDPQPDASTAAYDEFLRTGRKDDLARFLALGQGSWQVSPTLLFFSGKTTNKPVERVGFADSGVVVWLPKNMPDYFPEFGQWEPMELNYFLFKSRLVKDCYTAQLKALDAQLHAFGEHLKNDDEQLDKKLKAVTKEISDFKENAATEVATSETELQDPDAVLAALRNDELSRDRALTIVCELFDKQQKRAHGRFDNLQRFLREQHTKLLKMGLKGYRNQWRQWIKADSMSDSRFLFLFSVRYPKQFAAYERSTNFPLNPSENGCKETGRKAMVKKRKSQLRNKDGTFTKPAI
jgi:hypothetical protein